MADTKRAAIGHSLTNISKQLAQLRRERRAPERLVRDNTTGLLLSGVAACAGIACSHACRKEEARKQQLLVL